ncbi:hypothetical protein HYS03_00955 [Candidatus Woesebacteria bacterium]|nr:hypothetical protein [Candidatus Woesebacteria bacterium]QQG47224.1 MAG: hypothetical protein HY044_03770 [Candidatus Woesebacteria bacterium]
MAKKSLGQLLKNAEILQQAARLTKNFGELNDTILQILREYLNQVQVQFAPNRPHDWDNHLAVLEVVYGGFILKIPVPELKALDKGLSMKVRIKMSTNVKLTPAEVVEFFASLTDWDQWRIVSVVVEGTDMNHEFMNWLAAIGTRIAEQHPHVEIIAYAKRWHSFPRGSALCTDEYSGHNFARSPESAAIIASNLRYRAEGSVPTSLNISFCFHAGGARFTWERAAGMQSPTPIYNRGLNEEDVVWTAEQALAWAKKNWRSNVNLPESIKAAIYKAFGLGTEHKTFRSDGKESAWYALSPEDLQPDGYTPMRKLGELLFKEEDDDESLLGASTLKKLRDAHLFDENDD